MKKTGTPATAEAQERFMLRAGNATQWQSSAQILKDCAQLIGNFHLAAMDDMLRGEFSMAAVRHLMTGRVFFFMAGLAIENLVKGLLLHRGLVKVDSSQLPGPLKGHGINGKLGKLNIALSADETHMVKK